MKIESLGVLRPSPERENPLWLLFVGYPPFCACCYTILGPCFCAVEVPCEDGAHNFFRLLAPVCSPLCQKLLITERNALGKPGNIAWSPQKLRFVLDDPAQFAGVIDVSDENIAQLGLEMIIAAIGAAETGHVM
jgi:hypothetical protein